MKYWFLRSRIILLPFLFLAFICLNGRQSENTDTLKIGFLIREKGKDAALRGAAMAISKINSQGGINGIHVRLIVRSLEGPWGTGSKQAVDLIFEEKVLAIVGSLDGRNSHLVEQACTKTNVVFISAWSSDPTLAQAFVPWFFNCVPDNIKQSDLLIKEIFTDQKYKSVAAVTDNNYDSQNALKFFLREAVKSKNQTAIMRFDVKTDQGSYSSLISEIARMNPDCILILCSASNAAPLMEGISKAGIHKPAYSFLFLADENDESLKLIKKSQAGIRVPLIEMNSDKYRSFAAEYQRIYGVLPGLSAAFSYDSINMLAEAVRKNGVDRVRIQKYLLGVDYPGITGIIIFDELGNRNGPKSMMDL